jgi:hypothetical protein
MVKKKQIDDSDLDEREKIFAENYILTQNATEAARRVPGISESFAPIYGHRTKNRPHVKAYIEARLECALSDIRMSVDDVLAELQYRAMFDVSELYEDDGSVKRIKDMSPLARRMIEQIECVELFSGSGDDKHAIGLVKKVKIQSSSKAFADLAKYHGLLKDRVSHENPDGTPLAPPRIEIIVRDADGKA